jgi:hypothetical protein
MLRRFGVVLAAAGLATAEVCVPNSNFLSELRCAAGALSTQDLESMVSTLNASTNELEQTLRQQRQDLDALRQESTSGSLALNQSVAVLQGALTDQTTWDRDLAAKYLAMNATTVQNTREFGDAIRQLQEQTVDTVTLFVNTSTETTAGTNDVIYAELYSETKVTEQFALNPLRPLAASGRESYQLPIVAFFGTVVKVRLTNPGEDGWECSGIAIQQNNKYIRFVTPRPAAPKSCVVKCNQLKYTAYNAHTVDVLSSNTFESELGRLKGVTEQLSRSLLMQQTQAEQQLRAQGHSGLVKVRSYGGGSEAYNTASFSNFGAANVHDHSNNERTVGLGEFAAVLNGVQFSTRHNDYQMVKPHSTKTGYHDVENVDYPDVPQAVLDAGATINCCANNCSNVTMTGLPTDHPYFELMGTYVKTEQTTADLLGNHRSVYQHVGSGLFLYYQFALGAWESIPPGAMGWFVGPSTMYTLYLHTTNLGPAMFITDGQLTPQQVSGTWWYYNSTREGFPYSPTTKVTTACDRTGTVSAQVVEMREWFKAWQSQDYSVRDYRPYFKPVLTYLEGTWILDNDDLTDGFFSDRHSIDASTWQSLHDKVRFLMNNGRKSNLENLPFLPTCVRSINTTYDEDGVSASIPIVGNWEYRILSHPIEGDLPLDRFKIADDLHTQFFENPMTSHDLLKTRRARFQLNAKNQSEWYNGPTTYEFIDELMEKVGHY